MFFKTADIRIRQIEYYSWLKTFMIMIKLISYEMYKQSTTPLGGI